MAFKKGHTLNKGKNNPNYGKVTSAETIDKIKKSRFGIEPWNKGLTNVYSKDTLEKMSKSSKGKPKSNLAKQHMKENHYDCSGSNNPMFGIKGHLKNVINSRGIRSYYQSPYQGRIYLRSSYELAYAQYLDKNNKDWLYESIIFNLGDTTYTPDFFLIKDNKFIEIKGYMSKCAQNKINLFNKLYPDELLIILYRQDLKILKCFD